MVYYHFHSKAGLYGAAVDEMLSELRASVERQEPRPGTALEKVDTFVRVYAEVLAQPHSLTRAVFNDLPSLPPELQASVRAAYQRRILNVLEGYFGEASHPGIDVRDCAQVVSAIIHALARGDEGLERLVERARWNAVAIYAAGALTSSAP